MGLPRIRSSWLYVLLAASAAGCSHNPGYFPYLLPPGPIVQEHAKPRGPGYFRDFDPKARSLEVVPANGSAPLGSQVVLVATVYDKDGQPRRDRRVEWMIEGPGNIIEVDESGLHAGRGYKVDNKYAVGYTNYTGSCITRGNTDANDDVNIRPGQTFCVISSAVPGETVVTAYAPGVFNWDQGRVVSRIQWGDGRMKFTDTSGVPRVQLNVTAPPSAGSAGTFPAKVSLVNLGGVDSRDAQIRVTLSDGATLARSEPPPVRLDGNALLFDLAPVAIGKKQEVTLEVKPATLGNVTVTAEASTADGLKAENRVTTRIENGRLELHVEAPPSAIAGERVPVKLAVTNGGAVPAANVSVWARFDNGLNHSSGQNPVELTAGTLAPGETRMLDLPLSARTAGRYSVRASATADGNLSASTNSVAFEVRRAELQVAVTGPRLAYLNQEFTWSIAVGNPGDSTATNVAVRAALPMEVKLVNADAGKAGPGSVEWTIPELKPGEQRAFKLTALATKLTERATVSVVALGDVAAVRDNALEAKADATVNVVGVPAVTLEVATPSGVVEVGKRATFQVRVKNRGTVSAQNVDVTAFVPPELQPNRASGAAEGRIDPNGKIVFRTVDELRPGQTATFTIEVEAVKLGDARFQAEVKAAHLTHALKEEQATRIVGGR